MTKTFGHYSPMMTPRLIECIAAARSAHRAHLSSWNQRRKPKRKPKRKLKQDFRSMK